MTVFLCVCQRYPSVLLTAYSADPRVPLSGILRYAERLRNAVHTRLTTRPESGTYCSHICHCSTGEAAVK